MLSYRNSSGRAVSMLGHTAADQDQLWSPVASPKLLAHKKGHTRYVASS